MGPVTVNIQAVYGKVHYVHEMDMKRVKREKLEDKLDWHVKNPVGKDA